MAGRPLRRARSNPKRELRGDARVFHIAGESHRFDPDVHGGHCEAVVFFAPEVDSAPTSSNYMDFRPGSPLRALAANSVIGGVVACWYSGKTKGVGPGTVEYVAAGSGFGPAILEAAASIMQSPLIAGRSWSPVLNLFSRYPNETIYPGKAANFIPVALSDQRYRVGLSTVQKAASDAYNEGILSAGILPRYRSATNSEKEDENKLRQDERNSAMSNPTRRAVRNSTVSREDEIEAGLIEALSDLSEKVNVYYTDVLRKKVHYAQKSEEELRRQYALELRLILDDVPPTPGGGRKQIKQLQEDYALPISDAENTLKQLDTEIKELRDFALRVEKMKKKLDAKQKMRAQSRPTRDDEWDF